MPKINYNARDFNSVRTELVNIARQYYPELSNDLTDTAVFMTLLELNAAVGDMLSYHTDNRFNEVWIDTAQERSSLYSMARTFGLKTVGPRPSVTVAEISVRLPNSGDGPNYAYAPIIRAGAQISGGGAVFETLHDTDFSSPFNIGGIQNRTIIPNKDGDNKTLSYTVTKQVILVNGVTKIYKRTIGPNDIVPFFNIVLPEKNVLSVSSIIFKEGLDYNSTPSTSDFLDPNLKWYEVKSLSEGNVFMHDRTKVSDNKSIKVGKWIHTNNRFITERTDNGFTKIIFGSGTQDITALNGLNVNKNMLNLIGDFINNMSLGSVPPSNKTMFVQYRIGGGANANVGPNVLTTIENAEILINGADQNLNNSVKRTISVTNTIPALGGRDEMTIDELRYLIKYNFSAQNRAVTINDYRVIIGTMPSEFGSPYRCNIVEEQNKIKIYTINLDSSGKLSSVGTDTLKNNIAEYLADYRMINDYVEVVDGKVYNIGFNIDIMIEKQYPQSQIVSQVINTVTDFMDINKWEMGQNIYIGQLIEKINNINGVLNVTDIGVINKVDGGKYSGNEVIQPYSDAVNVSAEDTDTRLINILPDYTLYGDPVGIYEVKYPEIDIKVRVK